VSAAALVYSLVTQSLSPSDAHKYWVAGLASGIAFGLAPIIWSQAVVTEVYALHSLLVGLLLYLSINPFPKQFTRRRQNCLVGLTFGLAMGNHVTTILLVPVILFTTIIRKPTLAQGKNWINNWQLDIHSLLLRIIWGGIGLLVYFTLPLRALSHPPVNWGNPVTLDGFTWLVTGKLYTGLLQNLNFLSVLERVQAVSTLFLVQFGIIGFCVGLIGLIVYFKPTRLNYCMIWIVTVYSAFTIGYATTDAFMYLIPAFLCFAIWLGIGLGRLMDTFSRRLHGIGGLIGLILILTLLIQAWFQRSQVDASDDLRAESFGRNVLSLAPVHALVVTKGDEAVFTLWYFQYALGNRPDLAIIATDLLQFNWYMQTLHATYPDLNLPGPLPFAETVVEANPGRSICYVQYIQVPEINCLPARDSLSP
jgi:MFS family permease